MLEVSFYFYYGCPWTFLASTRLTEVAMRTSARIAWKPILLDLVAQAAGSPGHAPQHPARARYAAKDLGDWAEFCGVRIRHPGPFPRPATWALRGAVIALEDGRIAPYSEHVFQGCFGGMADIDSLDIVTNQAAAAGLDAAAFRRRVQEPRTREVIEGNSRELVARGGFGSPTLFVGDDMYFGNDRMPLVELALTRRGERPLILPGAHGQQ